MLDDDTSRHSSKLLNKSSATPTQSVIRTMDGEEDGDLEEEFFGKKDGSQIENADSNLLPSVS